MSRLLALLTVALLALAAPAAGQDALHLDPQDRDVQVTVDGNRISWPGGSLTLANPEAIGERLNPRSDSDGDGVPDAVPGDKCVDQPGVAPGGCPAPEPPADSDGDGFPDGSDLCPAEPGEAPVGCPPVLPADQDGDGVPDAEDSCPADPGLASKGGCPEAAGGLPGRDNTGVPPGTTLTPSAGITVRTAGAVIDGVQAPWIRVRAPNVTIRRSRIQCACGLPLVNDSTGLVVEDTEIHGQDGTGILFDNYTARRVEVTGTENGFNVGDNTTIIDSWVHNLDASGDNHTDGIQTGGGAGNVLIRHNNLEGVPGSNAAIIMHTGPDPQNHDWRIENNRLTDPHVVLYCPRARAQNIYVVNNRFGRMGTGEYTDSCSVSQGHVTEFSGNVDDITGALIRPGG